MGVLISPQEVERGGNFWSVLVRYLEHSFWFWVLQCKRDLNIVEKSSSRPWKIGAKKKAGKAFRSSAPTEEQSRKSPPAAHTKLAGLKRRHWGWTQHLWRWPWVYSLHWFSVLPLHDLGLQLCARACREESWMWCFTSPCDVIWGMNEKCYVSVRYCCYLGRWKEEVSAWVFIDAGWDCLIPGRNFPSLCFSLLIWLMLCDYLPNLSPGF